MIDTFLAKVQSVSDAAYDAQGHLRKEASITLLVYDGTSNKELTLTNGEDNYSYVKGAISSREAWSSCLMMATL